MIIYEEIRTELKDYNITKEKFDEVFGELDIGGLGYLFDIDRNYRREYLSKYDLKTLKTWIKTLTSEKIEIEGKRHALSILEEIVEILKEKDIMKMKYNIRKQLKGYTLNKETLDERFKGKKFKTDTGAGTRFYYDALYYGNDCISPDEYTLHELVSWIKTLLGTGANVHHPILYHINKEKAVEVVNEIIEIIKEKEEKSKIYKEPEYDMYDMVESAKEWPIIDEMKKQEEEKMKTEKKCNCGKDCKCKKEKSNSEKLFEKYPELKEPIKQKATLKFADGREIEVEISEEELKKIEVKKSPYDIITSENCTIYTVNDKNIVYKWQALGYQANDKYLKDVFDAVNSYNDKDFAEKCARADLLMRKLRKFAIESNLEHERKNNCSYQIVYDKNTKIMASYTRCISLVDFNVILFNTSDDCKEAIETFYDELIWYFTEYLKIYE